jgi:hypothetical protein
MELGLLASCETFASTLMRFKVMRFKVKRMHFEARKAEDRHSVHAPAFANLFQNLMEIVLSANGSGSIANSSRMSAT